MPEILVPKVAPELFIGLIGPVGTELNLITEALKNALANVKYDAQIIRISDILKQVISVPKHSQEDKRISSLMDAGNKFRENMKGADALALAAVVKIREIREGLTKSAKTPAKRTAYILNSIKTKAEVETLRNVYGRNFLLISAFSPRERRKEKLAYKIAESCNDLSNIPSYYAPAEKLISRDLAEEGIKFGQDVTNAFALADLFIDTSTDGNIASSVNRFIEILFSHPFRTPNKDEFGMFQAQAAALRSGDLSRQVGAAIMTKDGSILSLGCNEVPKAGGGFYWADDEKTEDARDYAKGHDSSALMKRVMIGEVVKQLQNSGIIPKKKSDLSESGLENFLATKLFSETAEEYKAEELSEALLYGDNSPIKSAQIMNILEFGRIVHAEMAAITDAAKRGIKLEGSTLFCTTFPCHMCARHIVAVGIERVVFIEPYPKSKAAPLHKDSIAVDKSEWREDLVNFQAFVGVSPRRYIDFFSMPEKRKDKKGQKLPWVGSEARLKTKHFISAYIPLELRVVKEFERKIADISDK